MRQQESSVPENLSEVLDEALTRLSRGEQLEACLEDYPQHAPVLEPLLRTSALLQAEAATPLHPDLETWLPTGARDFAAIAQQMLPQQVPQSQPAAAPVRAGKRTARRTQQDLSDVLDQALERIRAGASVEDSLAAYPQSAFTLEPLLNTGSLLRAQAATTLPPEMETWLRTTGARDFAAIAQELTPRYASQRKPAASGSLNWQRAVAAVAVAVALLGAADTASAASLPGQPLYTWKRAKEELTLSLATDPLERSQLHVDYAKRRLSEFNALVTTGTVGDSTLISEMLNNLLAHTHEALNEAAHVNNGTAEVKPEISRLMNQTEGALAQAAVIAPQVRPTLDEAQAQVVQIEQQLPPASASSPTEAPTPNASVTPTDSPVPTDTEVSTAERIGGQTPVGAPTNTPTSEPQGTPTTGVVISPSPTAGAIISTTQVPTVAPTDTPTVDPATAVPPTQEPPTNTPVEEPPSPTVVPPTSTPLPTDTPPPTATPIASPTEGPLPTLPPTPPPRPPRNTPTPTQAPTDTPTNTPEPTNQSAAPTDTPTITNTATIEPTVLSQQVDPTGTPTPTPSGWTPDVTPTDIPPSAAVSSPSAVLPAGDQGWSQDQTGGTVATGN